MADLPKVLGIIICERILVDVLRQEAISCVNIHNGFATSSFPIILPLIYAYAQVSGSHAEFTYQYKIMDSNNKEIAQSPLAKVEPLPNSNMLHKLISAIPGLRFDDEGTYNFILELNGIKVSHLPFYVVKVTAENEVIA